MKIEDRLVRDLGLTTNPEHAVWLLKDGTLVNGSYEGHQRDVDHHEISSYFKKSKREIGYMPRLYIDKFLRRGNIRWGCSSEALTVEFTKIPTPAQVKTILTYAASIPQTAFCHNNKWRNIAWFVNFIKRYQPLDNILRKRSPARKVILQNLK